MREPSEAAIRSTMQFVHTSDIPSHHKTVILEVLNDSLRHGHYGASLHDASEQSWTPEQDAELRTYLEDKLPISWQHADELVMSIATRLQRTPHEIRRKAAELGLASSVDYAIARRTPREK
jgi:hypothetical protein